MVFHSRAFFGEIAPFLAIGGIVIITLSLKLYYNLLDSCVLSCLCVDCVSCACCACCACCVLWITKEAAAAPCFATRIKWLAMTGGGKSEELKGRAGGLKVDYARIVALTSCFICKDCVCMRILRLVLLCLWRLSRLCLSQGVLL